MTPATYILLLVLGWLALSLAILWAMLRLARRAVDRPVGDVVVLEALAQAVVRLDR